MSGISSHCPEDLITVTTSDQQWRTTPPSQPMEAQMLLYISSARRTGLRATARLKSRSQPLLGLSELHHMTGTCCVTAPTQRTLCFVQNILLPPSPSLAHSPPPPGLASSRKPCTEYRERCPCHDPPRASGAHKSLVLVPCTEGLGLCMFSPPPPLTGSSGSQARPIITFMCLVAQPEFGSAMSHEGLFLLTVAKTGQGPNSTWMLQSFRPLEARFQETRTLP